MRAKSLPAHTETHHYSKLTDHQRRKRMPSGIRMNWTATIWQNGFLFYFWPQVALTPEILELTTLSTSMSPPFWSFPFIGLNSSMWFQMELKSINHFPLARLLPVNKFRYRHYAGKRRTASCLDADARRSTFSQRKALISDVSAARLCYYLRMCDVSAATVRR